MDKLLEKLGYVPAEYQKEIVDKGLKAIISHRVPEINSINGLIEYNLDLLEELLEEQN